MTQSRDALVKTLWAGKDPFARPGGGQTDFQGWASDNPLLGRAIEEVRPRVVVEIGVWKGGSVITMADAMKSLSLDGVIIAIDSWLGSAEHWTNAEWHESLGLNAGYPTLYRTFEANMKAKDLCDIVLPLPLDANNAVQVLRNHNIRIDVLHIDGAHDYSSIIGDLHNWWPLLNVGGVLIGDDYYTDGLMWPDVLRAFNEFFKSDVLENIGGKCWVKKLA